MRGLTRFAWVASATQWTKRHFGTLAFAGFAVTVATLVIEYGASYRESQAMESESVAQATMIAVMAAELGVQENQLAIQRGMATFVASGGTGPTATAMAKQASDSMAQMVRTLDALEAEKRKVEPTLTPAAQRVSDAKVPSAPPIGPQVSNTTPRDSLPPTLPSMRKESQAPGLSAELMEFSRFENTITVRLRFVNASQERIRFTPTWDTFLFDETTHESFGAVKHSNNYSIDLAAGGSLEVWAKYDLPAEKEPQYLTLILNHGVMFEHLEVPPR